MRRVYRSTDDFQNKRRNAEHFFIPDLIIYRGVPFSVSTEELMGSFHRLRKI